jgi:hypothetical protein
MMMLLSKPSILKSLHFLLIPFGIYVAAQTSYKIQPESISETHFRELTVNKTRALASTISLLVFIIAQLAMLYKFHDFGMEVNQFKLGYFVFSVINIILASIVLSEYSEFVRLNGSEGGPTGFVATMVMGILFSSLALIFNMANLYHISSLTGVSGKRMSPRRK